MAISPTELVPNQATIAFIVLFTVFRLAHFFCIKKGLQPFRTVFYLLGVACTLAVLVIGMYVTGKAHNDTGGFDKLGSAPQTQAALAASVCLFFLWIKYTITGIKAATLKPDDAKLPEDKNTTRSSNTAGGDQGAYSRWNRAHANEFENTIFFFIAFAIGAKGAKGWSTADDQNNAFHALTAFVSLYTIVRFMHTVCAVKQLQPGRSICWLLGVFFTLCTFFIGIIGTGKQL